MLGWAKKGGSTKDPGSSVKHHYGVKAVQQGESHEKKNKKRQHKTSTRSNITVMTMPILWQINAPRQCLAYRKTCTGHGKTRHFKKVCQSRRDQVVNEMEIKESQECSEGELETVSIDSVHLNKNQSLLMAELEMWTGNNSIVISYKIDTRSKGNIMPLFIFKKLFKNVKEDQLKRP